MQENPDPLRTRSFLEVIGYDYSIEAMRKFLTSNSYLRNEAAVTEELIQYRHEAAIRPGYKEANDAFDAYLKQMNNDPKLWDRYCIKDSLPKLKVPTIFLWGKDDTLAPIERAYELEKMLPNIEFTYIDDCGHQCQNDQPEIVNEITINFFRE
jgi:pimeloyl-ACP methyl ester carboxylesterase